MSLTAPVSIRQIIELLVRLAVGGLFLWSGLEKWLHPAQFEQAIMQYKSFSPVFLHFYGALLPKLEVLAGLYLGIGLFIRFASALTIAMLLSFIFAIAWMLLHGQTTSDCGCFLGGNHPEPLSWMLVVRDTAMLLLPVYLLFIPVRFYSLDNLLERI